MNVPTSGTRRQAFVVATILLGVFGAFVIGELAARFRFIEPHSQIVHGNRLRSIHGVPVWRTFLTDSLRHTECADAHPERLRVMFLGDSITAGTGISPGDVFTVALEQRLNELRPHPGFCVMNLSEAGFHFDQKLAILQETVEKYRPDLILWEVWSPEPIQYALWGDEAFSLNGWKVRPDGFPGVPGVPDVLNRFFFLHSRLYQYIDVDLAENAAERIQAASPEETFLSDRFPELPALVHSLHSRLALYLATPLDHPFRELLSPDGAPSWQQPYIEAAHTAHIPLYRLQEELKDEDYMAVRNDPCCHFNANGHRALERVFERIVLQQLDAGASPRQPDESRSAPAP